MDDLLRSIIGEKGAWAARDDRVFDQAPGLQDDYAARVLALLVERAGGETKFTREEIERAASRLALFVYTTEGGLLFEVRTLAEPADSN